MLAQIWVLVGAVFLYITRELIAASIFTLLAQISFFQSFHQQFFNERAPFLRTGTFRAAGVGRLKRSVSPLNAFAIVISVPSLLEAPFFLPLRVQPVE